MPMASQSEHAEQDWQSTKKTVLERNSYMFNNPFMSDVAFTCGGESVKKFYAHKYVLATSSTVFYAMFYGDLAETNSVIHLPDTEEKYFEEFLRFLYTDQCTLTPDNFLLVMYLGKKYLLPSLIEKCVAFVQSDMKPENVVSILEQVIQFDEEEMEKKCWEMIELETSKTVASDAFNQINQGTLINLLKRETLNIKEIELFQAVLKWSEIECSRKGIEATDKNRRSVLGDAIYQIRFLSMSEKEFAQSVSSSGVLAIDEIVPIFYKFNGLTSDMPSSNWELSYRRPKTLKKIRCDRFPSAEFEFGILSDNTRDCLSFRVNKPATFHGVRLFGDEFGSEYEVSLEVNGAKVSGTYPSELNDEGVWGFDVMLSKPIPVDANKIITMVASIEGPHSYYGKNGKSTVEVERGVTVTFITMTGGGISEETTANEGQFHQIILSV